MGLGSAGELQDQIKDQQVASLSFLAKFAVTDMSRLEISIWTNVQPDLKKLFILSKVKTGRISRWRSVLKEFPETPPDCCGAGISWQGWGGAREQPPSPCPAEEEEGKDDHEEKYGVMMTRTED